MPTHIGRHQGDLLSVTHGVIVHGCNAQGKMGRGVAKAVRERYPGAYSAYMAVYGSRGLHLGDIIEYVPPSRGDRPPLVIVNAITQLAYGRGQRFVDYEGLRCCFEKVAALARRYGLSDIHFPLIGCDRGGGDWTEVAPIIEQTLEGLNAHLWVLHRP